jgi:hypothetical protein
MVVVILLPGLQSHPRLVQRTKLVHVQTLITQPTVEGLDERVLGRLAGADEVELHTPQVTPLVERLGRKFRAVIDSYRVGQFATEGDFIHRIHDALAGQREVGLQRNALPMPLVDHRQHAKLPPVCQLVMNEIHGPVLTPARGGGSRSTVQTDALAPTHSHTYLEALQLVQPMDAVAAYPPAFPGQQDVQPFVAESRSCRRQFAQPLSQDAAVPGVAAVVPRRVPQTTQRAGAAYAQLKAIPYPSCDVPAPGRG